MPEETPQATREALLKGCENSTKSDVSTRRENVLHALGKEAGEKFLKEHGRGTSKKSVLLNRKKFIEVLKAGTPTSPTK